MEDENKNQNSLSKDDFSLDSDWDLGDDSLSGSSNISEENESSEDRDDFYDKDVKDRDVSDDEDEKQDVYNGENEEDDQKIDYNKEEKNQDEKIEKKSPNIFDDIEENDSEENINDRKDDNVVIGKGKAILIKKLLENIKDNNDKLMQILSPLVSPEDEMRIKIGQLDSEFANQEGEDIIGGKVIEGVFDGENMIGPDGKNYSMPANYASKSKLVEGDIMKLTITSNGTFVYKQIGPIERARIVGRLEKDNDGNYSVEFEGKKWRVLPASVTYFKGDVGDETIILVPRAGKSNWGAVENIIRNKE